MSVGYTKSGFEKKIINLWKYNSVPQPGKKSSQRERERSKETGKGGEKESSSGKEKSKGEGEIIEKGKMYNYSVISKMTDQGSK